MARSPLQNSSFLTALFPPSLHRPGHRILVSLAVDFFLDCSDTLNDFSCVWLEFVGLLRSEEDRQRDFVSFSSCLEDLNFPMDVTTSENQN